MAASDCDRPQHTTSFKLRDIVFPHRRRSSRLVDLATAKQGGYEKFTAEMPLSQEEESFVEWALSQCNLDWRKYRSETLARRLTACLRSLRASNVCHAKQILECDPSLAQRAVSSLLVGVTSFFRDANVFDELRDVHLPPMLESRHGLSIWSIGCSTGEELYSMAFLMQQRGTLKGSYLLGSDCRIDALNHARRGIYSDASVRGCPTEYLRNFDRCDGVWQVQNPIRASLRWRLASILTCQEFGLWDVILFRNTAIYFAAQAIPGLWEHLESCLRVGGLLVLGKAERPLGAKRLAAIGNCLYRKTRR